MLCRICRNLSVSGSVIGNLEMTQEMLDFCGKHNVTSDVEVSLVYCGFTIEVPFLAFQDLRVWHF